VKDSPARTLVANVVAGAGAQGITALAALWSIPQVLGIIGAVGYGVYALAGALVGYFSIADLGLANATLQRLGRARAADDAAAFNETVATSTALLGAIGLVLSGVLLLLAVPLGRLLAGGGATVAQRDMMVLATRLCAVGTVPTMVRPVLEAIFAASERLLVTYSISTTANLVRTIGAVVALHFYPASITPVFVLVGSSVLQFVCLLLAALLTTAEFKRAPLRTSTQELRLLFRISIPVWLTTGTTLIANQLDKMVVAAVCGLAAAGRYAVAFELASRIWMFPYIFSRAYIARLSTGLALAEPIKHERDIRGYATSSLSTAVIPAAALGVLAGPFLRAYTGHQDMGEAPVVFVLLLFGVVCNVASFAAFAVLQLKLHLKALAVPHVIFLVLHTVTCIVLTRSWGPTGAAASWSIGMLLLWLSIQLMLSRRYPLVLFTDLMRIFAGGGAAIAAMLIIGTSNSSIAFSEGAGLVQRLLPVASKAVGATAAAAFFVAVAFFLGRRGPEMLPK
jgi:O-antigen/teichoic acid export membrane protein